MKKKTGRKPNQREKKASPYMKDENPALRKVVRELRAFVKGVVPDMKETVNSWGVSTFERESPFCCYMVGKNHVTFGFHYGTSLSDPEGLLEGTGKNIRHVKLRTVEDLEQKGLKELVHSAAHLEGMPPMRGMSGKRS